MASHSINSSARASARETVQDNAYEHTADSRPVSSAAEASAAEGMAEHRPAEGVGATASKTSVSSASVAMGSSDASKPQEEMSRPTDDEIIAQENAIKAAEAQRVPFVGDKEPLRALETEYEAGSAVFVAKIRSLAGQYGGIRRTRGDGNCFFRSFIFAYLEGLVCEPDTAERDRLLQCIRGSRKKLTSAGFQELVFEDGLELLLDLIASAGRGSEPLSVAGLEESLRDASLSNLVVMFLRFLTSAEVQLREDFFAPFVMGMSDDALSVEQFCRRYVEPMGEESDHVHIVALSDALRVPIRVVYLDRSMALALGNYNADAAAVNYHDFQPESMAGAQPRVHLLYRPGHYDIMYPL